MAQTALVTFKQKFKSGAFQINDDDVMLFLTAVKEIVDKNPDIQDLLQDMKAEGEGFRINLELTTEPFWTAYIKIEDGKFETGWRKLENPTIRVSASKEVLMGIVTNQVSALKAYSEKQVVIEGQLMKAAALVMIFSTIGEELGLM